MADYSTMTPQADISSLKDALCAQQQLLQKLYNDLDAERESSATAASEALSMILRLQGEKSAIKMEAEQYKRLSEQKMCHAEESLEIIEDVIYQKEIEVATLDYQVQAYRYKLLSMGYVDPGVSEIKYPEDLLQRNEALVLDTGIHSIGRRNSAPIPLKYKKDLIERASSTSPETDVISKIVEEPTVQEINEHVSDLDKKVDNSNLGSISSYSKQIRELDERVKQIAGANYTSLENEALANLRNKSRSLSPQLSIGNAYDPNKEEFVNEIDQTKHPVDLLKNSQAVDNSCPANVHDVFEVPIVDQNWRTHQLPIKDKKKKACQGSENLEREDLIHPEAVKMHSKDEPEWMKRLLQSTHREKNLSKASNVAPIDYRLAVVKRSASASESQLRFNQLNRTSEIIEVEKTREGRNREEEIKLLNEIKEQINLLHDEIRHWKVKKAFTINEPSLFPISEAMLYFWL